MHTISKTMYMIEESTIEQPTEQQIKRPRGRPRKERPIEPVVKRRRGRPRAEKATETSKKTKTEGDRGARQ